MTGAEQRVLRHHLLAVLVPNDALYGATGIQEIDARSVSRGELTCSGRIDKQRHIADGGIDQHILRRRIARAVDIVAINMAAVGLNDLQRAVQSQRAADHNGLRVALRAANLKVALTQGEIAAGVDAVPAACIDDHLAFQVNRAVFVPDTAVALAKCGDLDVVAAELNTVFCINTCIAVDPQTVAVKVDLIGVNAVGLANGNHGAALEFGIALGDIHTCSGLADDGEAAVHIDVMVLKFVIFIVNMEGILIADDGASFYGQCQLTGGADAVLACPVGICLGGLILRPQIVGGHIDFIAADSITNISRDDNTVGSNVYIAICINSTIAL